MDASIGGESNNETPLVMRGNPVHSEEEERIGLSDGSPLYWALLPQVSLDSGVLPKREVQLAKDKLAECIAKDEPAVIACQGKTVEQARKALEGILKLRN